MKIFRYIFLLIFLCFPNDVKAKRTISFDSHPGLIMRFISCFFALNGDKVFVLPFQSKIKFRTFYNFDLGLKQDYIIYLSRKGKEVSGQYNPPHLSFIGKSESYECKNEATSFLSKNIFFLSKRKIIKKISERVDFCFDFSLSFLSFKVALLTKDGASFKFFHLPECKREEDKIKRGSPFSFSFSDCINRECLFFLYSCTGYNAKHINEHPDAIESVEKYFAFLYWLASCFTFWFDVRICSYLFCCIKIPIKSVFELFFLFRYLFLKKECDELSKEIEKELIEERKNLLEDSLDRKEYRKERMLMVCKKSFPSLMLASMLNFSIRL